MAAAAACLAASARPAAAAQAPSGDDCGAQQAPQPCDPAARVAVLERKLAHLRSWMASVASQVAASNPQLAKNARRLYVGGVPTGTTEVRRGARSGPPGAP